MYDIKFYYAVGDEVYDEISESICHIIGLVYSNGRNPFNNDNFFHRVIYYIDNPLFDGIRDEEQLQPLKDY